MNKSLQDKPKKLKFGKIYSKESNCDLKYVYGYNEACCAWERFFKAIQKDYIRRDDLMEKVKQCCREVKNEYGVSITDMITIVEVWKLAKALSDAIIKETK